jgi:hypothetical protein
MPLSIDVLRKRGRYIRNEFGAIKRGPCGCGPLLED